MAYLINDNLILISIPRTASKSVEKTLLNSNLKLKKFEYNYIDKNLHIHVPLNDCLNHFGNKESVCITRNWFDRWFSALNYIWDKIENETPFELICKWEEINNDFVFKLFDNDFLYNLHLGNYEGYMKCLNRIILNKKNLIEYDYQPLWMVTFISQKFWKSNQKCTYEFDIKEIDKFVEFIENRFGEKLIMENINKSTKRTNKMIIDNELKSFVWDNFEKRFEKRNQLI
jgi:hypothetical protein